MIAVIDVSEKQKEFVYSFPRTTVKEAAGAGSLLLCLDQLLREQGVAANDIEGIAVVIGEGRFSSTRSAVILANTFAYANKIPIAVVKPEEKNDEAAVRVKITQNKTQYLLPSYYAQPNITKKSN